MARNVDYAAYCRQRKPPGGGTVDHCRRGDADLGDGQVSSRGNQRADSDAVDGSVTKGLYSFSRNPIYILLTTIYLSLAIGADSVWSAIFVGLILLRIRYGVIAREERYLERKFNGAYVNYRNRVRRRI